MKILILSVFAWVIIANQKTGCPVISPTFKATPDTAPALLTGNFTDDYGIHYSINDSAWIQYPSGKYHIIRWNYKEQYLIARNDAKNHSDSGKYTRIDFMRFENMQPYSWGFCLTVYNAATDSLAEASIAADRTNPKKGCGGYPFSRMKRN